jgi:hypothetical protein
MNQPMPNPRPLEATAVAPKSPAVKPADQLMPSNSDFAPVCLTIFAGLGFLVLLTLGIAKYYHPDTAPLIKECTELATPLTAQGLIPEPVERLQYVASVFTTPLFLLGCFLGSRWLYLRTREERRRYLNWGAAALLAAGTVAAPIFAYQSLKNSVGGFFYVRAGVLVSDLENYTLLFFPCTALLAFFAHNRWISLTGKILVYALSTYVAVVVFFSVLYDRDSIAPWTYHLNPVIYPQAQVQAGKTLLVNCAPLYGLYPQFLQPLFEVFPLSVYSFTMVMAIFMVASLASIWFFLRKLVRNDFVFVAGFAAAAFYSYLGPKMLLAPTRPDPYFQYAPIRMLFPCLLLVLATLYLRGIGKRRIYYATFACAALALLWNPDSGLVVFGAWFLLLGYLEVFRNPWRASLKPILGHALTAFVALLLALGGYALFALLRSGHWPDWQMTAQYYKLFSHYGYGMLPMGRLPHLWVVIIVVCLVAMTVAIRGLIAKADEKFCGMLFLLTVLEAGLFAYYQGRSHDYCLIPMLYIPMLIVTLLADHVLTGVKSGDHAYYKFLPLAVLLFYFTASAGPSVLLQSRRYLAWIREGSSASVGGAQGVHSKNIEFIRQHAKPGERIFILVGGVVDGMYYAESATASALDVASSNDWFFKSDINQVVKFIQENKATKLFVIPGQYTDLTEILKSSYRLVSQERQTGLAVLLPAGSAVPSDARH